MARSYSWYHAARHATYKKNDVIKMDGTYYTSADGKEKYGTNSNKSRYFNSHYATTAYTVLAPICFSYTKDHMWAYAKASTIVSGGTLDTYTIKYKANGGTGAPASQTKTYGKKLTLRTAVPTREGHNFVGWATSSSATSASYKAGASFTKNANTTLYAVWSPYKHTVAYNANGGSGAPDSQTKTYGSVLKLSAVKPTRTGHTFQGWGTSTGDTTVNYASGADYGRDQNGGTYTLYAIWKANTYEVKYNANGGSNAPDSQIKTYGKDLTLRTTKPTRTNYTFLGWGTASNDTSVDYSAGDIYSENKGITLYAIWKLNNYSVTYVLNGGTNSSSNKTSVMIGTALPLSSPTRKGYTFVGWHLNSQSGEIVTSIPSTNTKDVTLYAEWKTNTYTIKIDLNGGKYEGATTVASIKANYGSTVDLFIPERDNYDFNKWSVVGLGSVSSDNLTFTVGDSDVTLKALWGLEILTVTYNANGGILGYWEGGYYPPPEGNEPVIGAPVGRYGEFTSVQYQYGDDISKYIIPEVTRDLYNFLGWYNGDEKVESPYAITEDITLVAKWRKIDTCYVYNKQTLYNQGLPHIFIKDENDSLKAEEGFIYVFKDGKFIRGIIAKEE